MWGIFFLLFLLSSSIVLSQNCQTQPPPIATCSAYVQPDNALVTTTLPEPEVRTLWSHDALTIKIKWTDEDRKKWLELLNADTHESQTEYRFRVGIPWATWKKNPQNFSYIIHKTQPISLSKGRAKSQSSVVRILDDGWFRYLHYITLSVRPISTRNKATVFVQELEIQLRNSEAPYPSYHHISDPLVKHLYASVVVNDEQAIQWLQKPPPPKRARIQPSPPTYLDGILYRFHVRQDRLYIIRYEDLKQVLFPVDEVPPDFIQLYDAFGNEVAMKFVGDNDGVFEPGEYFLIRGAKYRPPSIYQDTFQQGWFTRDQVYSIVPGTSAGRRWQTEDASPSTDPVLIFTTATREFQEQDIFLYSSPIKNDDHWYWQGYININCQSCVPERLFTVKLPDLCVSTECLSANILFQITILGLMDRTHHIQVYNDTTNTLLIDDTFTGFQKLSFSATVSPDTFAPGENTIRVVLVNDVSSSVDAIVVDRIQITYPQKFIFTSPENGFEVPAGTWRITITNIPFPAFVVLDVTNPHQPIELTNGVVTADGNGMYEVTLSVRAISPRKIVIDFPQKPGDLTLIRKKKSQWSSPKNRADMIIVLPKSFMKTPNLRTYITLRENKGYRVQVVPVEDIYDEFAGGLRDPYALKKFFTTVFANWQPPAPAYALLVGDPTIDYLNDSHDPQWTFLTPMYIEDENPSEIESFLGQDFIFTTVAGNDTIPDIITGRISARDETEFDTILSKLIDYEMAPGGDWEKTITMVAGDTHYAEDVAFINCHDAIINTYCLDTSGWIVNRVYYDQCCTTSEEMRQAVTSAWNAGTVLLTYAGHGYHTFWGYNPFLRNTDPTHLDAFTPQPSLPLVFNVSCRTSGIYKPYIVQNQTPNIFWDAFLETFHKLPQKGTIASLGPATVETISSVIFDTPRFYQGMFDIRYRYNRLGDIIFHTWVSLLQTGSSLDAKNLILLGDPLLKIRLPFPETPTNLQVTQSNDSALLTWDPISDAIGYHVYRSTDGCQTFTRITTQPVTQSTYPDGPLNYCANYCYRVTALSSASIEGRWSAPASVFLTPTPPDPPQNPSAVDTQTGFTITLSWSPPSNADNVVRYYIGFGTQSGIYDKTIRLSVSVCNGTTCSYDIHGLQNGITYYFAIYAEDLCGQKSDWSTEVSASPTWHGWLTTMQFPTLRLKKSGSDVVLEWVQPSSPSLLGYYVYRHTSPQYWIPDYRIATISDPTLVQYTDTGALLDSQNGFYMVTYFDSTTEYP